MAVFTACAATTHLLSALTHVWPDDHTLVRGRLCWRGDDEATARLGDSMPENQS